MPHSTEPILTIDPSWRIDNEDMGSKPKFWFRHEGEFWLYKKARPDTGEHWAEKIASEIAELMELPTHCVKIAEYKDDPGCAVRSFLGKGETLIHGNELLSGVIEGYDKEKWRGQSDHNFPSIVNALERFFQIKETKAGALHRFIGYMALDALVGNTDRHHENWGIVQKFSVTDSRGQKKLRITLSRRLAPTFDHGSCLGRELLEERARRLLSDQAALHRYIERARGGIFKDSSEKHGMSPISLLRLIAEEYPEFFKSWKKRLACLPADFAAPLVERVPGASMSSVHKEFVLAFLRETRKLISAIE